MKPRRGRVAVAVRQSTGWGWTPVDSCYAPLWCKNCSSENFTPCRTTAPLAIGEDKTLSWRAPFAGGLSCGVQARSAELCQRRRAHAARHRRAAGGGHPQRPAAVAPFRQQGDQDLSGLCRVLRAGRRHRAGGQLLPPCGAGAGRKEADPLPARPGRRRQELDRRAPEIADAGGAFLRDQGFAGERVAARPVRSGRGWRHPREGIRHPAPLPHAHPVAVGGQAAWKSSAATSAASGWSSATRACSSRSASPRPSRATRTTRTSRAWSARSTSASSNLRPGRPGRLQLLRRSVPRQPGPARIRRDVQGADQGAAPAADRDPGRQLQGHRGLRRHPLRRRRARALERERMESLPQQQEQRGLPRPHLHRQGALLPARLRRSEDLREAAARFLAGRKPPARPAP
jgi:hypothetical protein